MDNRSAKTFLMPSKSWKPCLKWFFLFSSCSKAGVFCLFVFVICFFKWSFKCLCISPGLILIACTAGQASWDFSKDRHTEGEVQNALQLPKATCSLSSSWNWPELEALFTEHTGKGSRRECCSPHAKDRRWNSSLLLAEEREWHFPTYFPLCWPYQHGRQHSTKPQRKKAFKWEQRCC